jgi:hypothetical protein
MGWLKNFDLRRWWITAGVVGLVITLAALPGDNRGGILVGLGVISCGLGEWMNHRVSVEKRYHGTLITYPRLNRPIGLVLDGLGIVLTAVGFYRFVE